MGANDVTLDMSLPFERMETWGEAACYAEAGDAVGMATAGARLLAWGGPIATGGTAAALWILGLTGHLN